MFKIAPNTKSTLMILNRSLACSTPIVVPLTKLKKTTKAYKNNSNQSVLSFRKRLASHPEIRYDNTSSKRAVVVSIIIPINMISLASLQLGFCSSRFKKRVMASELRDETVKDKIPTEEMIIEYCPNISMPKNLFTR